MGVSVMGQRTVFMGPVRSSSFPATCGRPGAGTPWDRHNHYSVVMKTCKDTPGWDNKSFKSCAQYESHGWCKGGDFTAGSKWTGGEQYNFPEKNCCACGKPS